MVIFGIEEEKFQGGNLIKASLSTFNFYLIVP
jgi:hypothetical protein